MGTILSQFGPSVPRARSVYRVFVTEGVAQGRRTEFQEGGLRRSVGTWAGFRALRQAGTPTAADARILGCSEFVARLLTAADAKTRDTLRICRPQPPLDALA